MKYRVKTRCLALLTEVWEVDGPDGMTEEQAEEAIWEAGDGVRFVDQETTDERDRQVLTVEAIGGGG